MSTVPKPPRIFPALVTPTLPFLGRTFKTVGIHPEIWGGKKKGPPPLLGRNFPKETPKCFKGFVQPRKNFFPTTVSLKGNFLKPWENNVSGFQGELHQGPPAKGLTLLALESENLAGNKSGGEVILPTFTTWAQNRYKQYLKNGPFR